MSELSHSNTSTGTAEEPAAATENMSGDGYTRVTDFDPEDKESEYFVWTGNKYDEYDEYGKYLGFSNSEITTKGLYIQKWIFSKKTLKRYTVDETAFSIQEGIKMWDLYKKNGTPNLHKEEEDTHSDDAGASSTENPSSNADSGLLSDPSPTIKSEDEISQIIANLSANVDKLKEAFAKKQQPGGKKSRNNRRNKRKSKRRRSSRR